jgi:hypothetical protein
MAAKEPGRQRALVEKLMTEYQQQTQGSAVDVSRIRALVLDDPELIAQVFPAMLQFNVQHGIGIWGLLYVVAGVYEKELADDSLSVLMNNAANEARVTLPKVLSMTASETAVTNRIVELQMAEQDVQAGDAHRVLTTMRLERMPAEIRERTIGRCIISFPVAADPRPIQRIPEVRRFVADLHDRMRYFPFYLNFDRKYAMHLVYFGCLADEDAIQVKGTDVRLDMLNESFVLKVTESLQAIRETCRSLNLNWQRSARQILAVYDESIRRSRFGEKWEV